MGDHDLRPAEGDPMREAVLWHLRDRGPRDDECDDRWLVQSVRRMGKTTLWEAWVRQVTRFGLPPSDLKPGEYIGGPHTRFGLVPPEPVGSTDTEALRKQHLAWFSEFVKQHRVIVAFDCGGGQSNSEPT